MFDASAVAGVVAVSVSSFLLSAGLPQADKTKADANVQARNILERFNSMDDL